MAFWRRKKKEPPLVFCYGKLPATGDFVRHLATEESATSFDEWLGRSIASARQSMGDAFSEAYRQATGLVVYRGSDGSDGGEPARGLVAVWAASGDSAGRQYPMLVGCSYDYEEMLSVGAGLPLAVWPFLQASYDLVANGRQLAPAEFVARVGALQPVDISDAAMASSGYQEWIARQKMGALWDTGWGQPEARYVVLSRIIATLELFKGKERPPTSLALRLPIGRGDAYAAAVWVDLVTRLGGWSRTVLNAFWVPQNDVLIHLGPPAMGTFRELIQLGNDSEFLSDLLEPSLVDVEVARQGLPATMLAALDDPSLSIASFLDCMNS